MLGSTCEEIYRSDLSSANLNFCSVTDIHLGDKFPHTSYIHKYNVGIT